MVEVLVALAVFAVAAVALAAAYINVLNAYNIMGRSNAHEEEIRFARSLLLAEPEREKAEEGGDFESADGRRVQWRATIEATATADLYHVTFTCEIADTGTDKAPPPREETFLVLRPTWAEGDESIKLREESKARILEMKERRVP